MMEFFVIEIICSDSFIKHKYLVILMIVTFMQNINGLNKNIEASLVVNLYW